MEDKKNKLKHPSLSSLTRPVLFQIQTDVPSKGSLKSSVLFSAKAKFDISKHNAIPRTIGTVESHNNRDNRPIQLKCCVYRECLLKVNVTKFLFVLSSHIKLERTQHCLI